MKITAPGDLGSRGGVLLEEQALPKSTSDFSLLETTSSTEEAGASGNDATTDSLAWTTTQASLASTSLPQSDAQGEPTRETITFENEAWGLYTGTERLAFSGLYVSFEGLINGTGLGWNSRYSPLEITSTTDQTFDFESVIFKAGAGTTIVVEGWNGDQLVATTTLEIDSSGRLDGVFGDEFHGIDRLVITADAALRVDDFVFVTYAESSPEPTNTEAVFGTTGLAGSVIEDTAPKTDGTVSVVDPDPDEAGVAARSGVSGDYGTFSITEAGDWTYTLGAAADALVEGETRTDRFTVASLDGSATETVTVTINGTDDPAVFRTELSDMTGSVVEDTETTATGRLVVEDPDAGEARVLAMADVQDSVLLASASLGSGDYGSSFSEVVAGTYGSFSIAEDGSWTYTLDAAADALTAGETATDSFIVSSLDGSATETVTMTVTGTDDPAVFQTELSDMTGSVVEDTETTATGRLVIEDPDAGEAGVLAQSGVAGNYGSFSITEDGEWTYTLDDDALAEGETRTDSFTVTSLDGSANETITVAVNGTGDRGDEPELVSDSSNSQPSVEGIVIDVSNAAELMAALESASGGETIRLASGNYGTLKLRSDITPWANFDPPVTITSADQENPASFGRFDLKGVSGLTFEDLLFDYTSWEGAPTHYDPFEIQNSSNITIRDSIFDGDIAFGVDDARDGYPAGIALNVGSSKNIEVEGTEFVNWYKAAIFGGVDDVRFVGNEVHEMRSDGLNFVGVQNVLVEDNYFHDFRRAPETGDHADMIQLWSTPNRPSVDITIRDNLLMMGEGDSTQSIFMRNGEGEKGNREMFYQDIVIENNLIWNDHSHGITVGETEGLTIRNNTLLQNMGEGSAPQINLKSASENVTVTGNIAAGIPGAMDGWTVADNLVVQRDSPNGANYYDDLFVNALNDRLAGLEDLQALPGGVIEQNGYGADITRYDPTPDALTALVRQEKVAGEYSTYTFDASFSAAADGRFEAGEAQFLWNFGDGTTAEGITARHDYVGPGIYTVTLEVVLPDGTRDTSSSRIEVANPVLFDVEIENGNVIDTSLYEAGIAYGDTDFIAGRDGKMALEITKDTGLTIDERQIDHLFDLEMFSLSFGFRATAPGEVLRIHRAFEVDLTSGGQVAVELTNAEGQTFTLASPRGLLDGDWHDVTITFDGVDGLMQLYVDGTQYDFTEASGHTKQMEHWGLYVGGLVSWIDGFTGALDNLEFRGDVLEPYEIAEQHGALSPDGLAPPIVFLDDFEAIETSSAAEPPPPEELMTADGTVDEAWL